MTSQLYHFDSYFANKIITNNSYTSCSNVNYILTAPIKKVKTLSLKSAEIPFMFGNIRTNNDSIHLTYTITYTDLTVKTYRLYINDGNYLDIASLITALNTNNSSNTLTSTITTIPNKGILTFYTTTDQYGNIVVCIKTDPLVLNVSFPQGVLSNYILGFNPDYANVPSASYTFPDFSVGNVIFGNKPVNIVVDTFICLNITNIPSYSTSASKNIITFKIPFINSVYYSLFQYVDLNYIKQTVKITDSNFNLSNLQIQITDRFGYLIDFYYDFSFTLEITTN